MSFLQKTLLAAALALPVAAQAAGDIEAGKEKSAMCAACHGANGVSQTPMFPTLAGQHESYLIAALEQYRGGQRKNPTMAPMAAALSDEDIENLAAYFAHQEGPLGAVKY